MPDDKKEEEETENVIIVSADRPDDDGGGGGGFWSGFGGLWASLTTSGQTFFSDGAGGSTSVASEPEKEEETEENVIVVEADRPEEEDFSEPPLTYGEFINAFLGYLDGIVQGADGVEFKATPPNIEYDLSVDVENESATATVYDRWNETATKYYYDSDGNYAQFDVPIDNMDFTQEGQYSNPLPDSDYAFF